MSATFNPRGDEPLFTLGECPIRFITLLVAFHSAAMILAALFSASGHGAWLETLTYSSTAVAHGQIWRLVTYAFVAQPDIFFLLEMLMLYYFGKEVESGLGWPRFAVLYGGLILIGPLLLQAFGYAGIPQTLMGAQVVNFAVFAAFVTMHPGAQFFFGVAARWVFLSLLAIQSLQLLSSQPTQMLALISSSLMAIVLMRRAGFEEPLFGWAFQWSLPQFRKVQARFSVISGGLSSPDRFTGSLSKKPPSEKTSLTATVRDPEQEMDRLLEKISSKGMESLSADERTALEQARQAILQRDGRNSR